MLLDSLEPASPSEPRRFYSTLIFMLFLIFHSLPDVLKVASEVDRDLLQQQTEAAREKQRNRELCDKLLQHIHSL